MVVGHVMLTGRSVKMVAELLVVVEAVAAPRDISSRTEMKNLDDSAFAFSAKHLRQFAATKTPEQKAPAVPPAFAHLFNHQATSGDGGNQGGSDKHKFTTGAQAFADQKGK